MSINDITFDASTHTYRTAAGVNLPSVTQVLAEADFYKGKSFFSPVHARRGQYVHEWMAHYATGGDMSAWVADTDSREALAWRGYVQAGIRFFTESGFVATGVEVRVANLIYGYAGTADLIGFFPRSPRDYHLIDLKTGALQPADRLQTATYAAASELTIGNNYGLYLSESGTYKLNVHADSWVQKQENLAVFLSALACYKFKAANGLLSKEVV